MGSLGFMGDDESQPGSKKLKLSRKLLNECDGVNNALVPKKPRSAIKKRGREVITPISKEQRLGSNGVGNKSKQMKKKGRISKDEKEVVETLNALADMFFDAANTIDPVLDDEPSTTIQEHDDSIEDSGIPSQAVNLKDLTFNGKSDFSGAQSDSSPINRVNVSIVDNIISSGELANTIEHVRAPGFQYGKNYCSKDDQSCMGFYQSPISAPSGKLSSSKQVSPLGSPSNRLPAWLEKAKCSIQPPVNENKATSDKYNHKNVVGLNSCWKRCAAHIHISHLVKVMQTSDTKEALLEKPTSGVVFCNGNTHSGDSAEIQNAILLHQRLIQDQTHLPCNTSVLTKQGSNFLSLSARDCDMNNHLTVPFSQPQGGWWSNVQGPTPAVAPQQVHQVKWTCHLQDQYNSRVACLLSSKYQQFSPSQQELMAMRSSFQLSSVNRNHNQAYPLRFQQNKWLLPTPTNL